MNFVTKNLGWILLFFFFLFMLFVISSNEGAPTTNSSGASVEDSNTGATQENLDSLVEMIDKQEVSGSGEIINMEEQAASDEISTSTGSIKNKKGFFSFMNWGKGEKKGVGEQETETMLSGSLTEDTTVEENNEIKNKGGDEANELSQTIQEDKEVKKSLFSKIFSREQNEEDTSGKEENEDLEDQTKSGTLVVEENENIQPAIPREDLIGIAGETEKTSTKNVMKQSGTNKNVSYADIRKYAPEILSTSSRYPGVSLETEIGKNFEIGVHSLKLNNKYFNNTLGYMMRGDTIKQLTSENRYGCFKIEILRSQLNHNVGKTGYVCKKYLQDTGDNYQVETSEVVESPILEKKVEVTTQIGDFITIEKSNVMLGDTLLDIGDVIDQMTDATNGCFVAHVYKSVKTVNVGQIGMVCVANLY